MHGVCVSLPATYLEPGRVEAHGSPVSGILEVGRFPGGSDADDDRVVAALAKSGVLASTRTDVMAWKRSKLLQNLCNALEVLCGRVLEPESVTLLDRLSQLARDEARACFVAGGQRVVDDDRRAARLAGQTRRRSTVSCSDA